MITFLICIIQKREYLQNEKRYSKTENAILLYSEKPFKQAAFIFYFIGTLNIQLLSYGPGCLWLKLLTSESRKTQKLFKKSGIAPSQPRKDHWSEQLQPLVSYGKVCAVQCIL